VKARLLLASVVASLSLSSPAFAAPVLVDAEKGIAVNLGAFLQPWFQMTVPTASGGGSPGVGAPDGSSPSFDFFLRRVRLMAFGSVTPQLSFFIETDQPDFGKGGNFTSSMFIQDAFLTYAFAPQFKVDAGMMLVPFSRHTIEGAIGLNAIDYHGQLIRLPAGKIWRDTGVQVRGLLLQDRLHYRLGIFEGVRNGAQVFDPPPPNTMAPPTPPALNDAGLPRVTGQLRYNLMGSEADFFLKGIYFSPTPLISFGVGADLQHNAVYVGADPGTYFALSVDAFVEYPFSADDEVIVKANFFHYSDGRSWVPGQSALANGGFGFFFEAGYRHGFIEPLVYIEYLRGGDDTLEIISPHVGVNCWVTQHNFNLKADVGYRRTDAFVGTGIDTNEDILLTVQSQLYF
jgi:hypothetical protein